MTLDLAELDPIEKCVMDSAVDDYTTLYEVLGTLNGLLPELAGAPGMTIAAARIVRRLVSDGWVRLMMWSPYDNREASIAESNIDAVLNNEKSWARAEKAYRPAILATPDADIAFHGPALRH